MAEFYRKEKAMKILLRVSIILLAVWVLITNTVKAEETPKYPEMYGTQLPAICGPTDVVRKLIDDEGYIVFSISNGRAGGNPDGEVIFFVTHWIHKVEMKQMITVTGLSGAETCIYFVSFDVTINPTLGGLES